MSPARALRLAMARVAERRLGLDLVVTDVAQEGLDQEALVDGLDDDALLVLIEGPEGAAGVLTLDRSALAALIEQQTTGRVTDRAAEERAFTATDAALAQPLIDGLFERAATDLSGSAEAAWVKGMRFGAWLPDLRTLTRALQAPDYRQFRFSLELGGGARTGTLTLALPQPEDPPAPVRRDAEPPRLAEAALRATAELRVVLHRLQIPIARVGRLAPGERFAIPGGALESAELEAPDGRVLCKVRLGRVEGMRAVRLPGRPKGLPGAQDAPDTPEETPRDESGPDRPQDPSPPEVALPPIEEADPPARTQPSAPESDPFDLPDLPPLDFEPVQASAFTDGDGAPFDMDALASDDTDTGTGNA